MTDSIQQHLQRYFGFRALRPGQEAVIQHILDGDSAATDIRPLVLRTLLTYLELAGYLQGGTPYYADYSFKPLYGSREILGRFDGERRQFLAGLFRQAGKGRSWFKLDLQ